KGGDTKITGTDIRAGSTLDAYQGLANVVTFTGLPLSEAIKLWTVNPAMLVGLSDRIGTIEVGKDADFILFG
ncbi:MAG: amidohydrolase family protein, partial [Clostridiales bacterium]|nr:amidohydrolase family protein [Clostridiales bacterium]